MRGNPGRRHWLAAVVLSCSAVLLPEVQAAESSSVDDATTARTMFESGNVVGALPYYERLVQKEPKNPLYAERLAYSLTAQLAPLPAGEQRKALLVRATAEAQRARSLGDNSNLLQTLLRSLEGGTMEAPSAEVQELAAAETAFTRGEYDKALAAYEAVAAANPLSYSARLFAGDVHYVRGNIDAAGKWFQAAIDLNPNVETAHRYWGDALAKVKREDEALQHYIDAVVAEPYNRNSWMGLQQWAGRNKYRMQKPNIQTPAAPTIGQRDDGKPNIGINMSPTKNVPASAAWLIYSMTRSTWMLGEFNKRYPQEGKYRHSLAEEAAALRAAVAAAKLDELDLNGADKELQGLAMIGKADLIEPYVLLQSADDGIARDYNDYRAANRDKLVAYIRQIVLAPQ
jgi:tetratricopeptide (TPR) repeat protein